MHGLQGGSQPASVPAMVGREVQIVSVRAELTGRDSSDAGVVDEQVQGADEGGRHARPTPTQPQYSVRLTYEALPVAMLMIVFLLLRVKAMARPFEPGSISTLR